ncbi:FAD-dependent oxidoreductase [uncultured Kordia sp.]|uniref:NAD(P)/FAD-dependent oxidoreductase n=1 Tax=uncultured Kordia sp. TaxID=507699 RepID=UPI002627DD57|nr:FAD-dependent oxidoreductase [uncultured Kordia sp.]
MNLSYWEYKTWLTDVDFTIVGSGIVGLNCALQLRKQYPTAKIIILEKGILPHGASTKNAGFACFGSLSEILDDLNTHSEQEVLELVKRRCEGLQLLRSTLGDATIDFQQLGGYELFTKEDTALYESCLTQKTMINKLLKPIFKENVFSEVANRFNFQNIQERYIFNQFEGQIDTGKMMQALLQKVLASNIQILNSILVQHFEESGNSVHIETNHANFYTKKLFIATNGFAAQLLDEKVKPARAQVLITEPIPNLHIKGTFHLDKGYYYFRNIDNRILFGGGRNLDFEGEETTEFKLTELIQNKLDTVLKNTILPNTPFKIEHRWSGIMGVGSQKKAIVKPLSNHVFCGIRLGGMGVAIGSLVGKELAKLV